MKVIEMEDIGGFCNLDKESLCHLFYECNSVNNFWKDLAKYIFERTKLSYYFTLKDVIFHYENKCNTCLEYIVNLFILLAKFYIHKQKSAKSSPTLTAVFCIEFKLFISTVILLKKNEMCIKYYDTFYESPVNS